MAVYSASVTPSRPLTPEDQPLAVFRKRNAAIPRQSELDPAELGPSFFTADSVQIASVFSAKDDYRV